MGSSGDLIRHPCKKDPKRDPILEKLPRCFLQIRARNATHVSKRAIELQQHIACKIAENHL